MIIQSLLRSPTWVRNTASAILTVPRRERCLFGPSMSVFSRSFTNESVHKTPEESNSKGDPGKQPLRTPSLFSPGTENEKGDPRWTVVFDSRDTLLELVHRHKTLNKRFRQYMIHSGAVVSAAIVGSACLHNSELVTAYPAATIGVSMSVAAATLALSSINLVKKTSSGSSEHLFGPSIAPISLALPYAAALSFGVGAALSFSPDAIDIVTCSGLATLCAGAGIAPIFDTKFPVHEHPVWGQSVSVAKWAVVPLSIACMYSTVNLLVIPVILSGVWCSGAIFAQHMQTLLRDTGRSILLERESFQQGHANHPSSDSSSSSTTSKTSTSSSYSSSSSSKTGSESEFSFGSAMQLSGQLMIVFALIVSVVRSIIPRKAPNKKPMYVRTMEERRRILLHHRNAQSSSSNPPPTDSAM